MPRGVFAYGLRPLAHGPEDWPPWHVPCSSLRRPSMYQTPIPTTPRVLVADDQSDILQALRLLLVDAGLETELVNSVEGIRDRVSKSVFDLLLMDLNYTRDTTSGKEGLDVITEVR